MRLKSYKILVYEYLVDKALILLQLFEYWAFYL